MIILTYQVTKIDQLLKLFAILSPLQYFIEEPFSACDEMGWQVRDTFRWIYKAAAERSFHYFMCFTGHHQFFMEWQRKYL